MSRKILLVLMLVAATSCKKKAGSVRVMKYEGLPANKIPTCAWAAVEHRGQDTTGTCVVDGRAYLCVTDREHDRIACALATPPVQPEAPVAK